MNRAAVAVLCGALFGGGSLAAHAADPADLSIYKPFAPPVPTGAIISADPRDFEGVYMLSPGENYLRPISGGDRTDEGEPIPPFTPAAAKIFWHRVAEAARGAPVSEPSVLCEPSWKTRTSSMMQFVQSPQVLVIFFAEHHIVRLVHLDVPQPAHPKPSYMGHSVGHWQGETLVIDTIGFNDRGWFDFAGTPQSSTLHLVERMTKQPDGTIQDDMTFEDPALFRHSFVTRDLYRPNPPQDAQVDEEICEENERNYDLAVH